MKRIKAAERKGGRVGKNAQLAEATTHWKKIRKSIMPRLLSLITLVLLAATSAYGDVYKWVGTDGKVHYSDQPPYADTGHITVPKTSGIEPPRDRQSTSNNYSVDKPDEHAGKVCKFSYYAYRDEKGQALAADAKQECLRNEALKKEGRGAEASYEAYNLWKDHRTMSSDNRNKVLDRASQMMNNNNKRLTCMPNYIGGFNCN